MKKIISILGIVIIFSFNTNKLIAQSWVKQNVGFATPNSGIGGISIVDSNTVWVWACEMSGYNFGTLEFSRTINGGNTWIANTINGYSGYRIGNLEAFNDSTAIVLLFNESWSTCYLLKTINAGITWTPITPSGLFVGSAFFHFFDINNGVCVSDPSGSYFTINTTSNGGITWTTVSDTNIPSIQGSEWSWPNQFDAFGDTIWFATTIGRLFNSTDKGLHWSVSNIGLTGTGDINVNLKFKNSYTGIVTQNSPPYLTKKTIDGGNIWTTITPSGYFVQKPFLAPIPGNNSLWVDVASSPGKGSSVSNDDCYTFMNIDTGLNKYTCVKFYDLYTGWAGGINTSSTDGGIYKWNGVLPGVFFIASQTSVSACTKINFQETSTNIYTSWNWSFPGATPNTSTLQNPINIFYDTPGNYNVTLIATNGTITDTITNTNYIRVYQLTIDAGSDQTITCGNSTTLTTSNNYTGSGSLQYNWLPSTGLNNTTIANPTATPITNTNYIVTVTIPGGGCTATDTVLISNTISTYNPEICLVTIDSLSQYNLIMWEKPIDATISSFLIYRDTANNNFGLIGEVLYASLSEFIDTARHIYAANGDPNYASWRYKIAIKDICGNISSMSPYHQTIFLQHNGGNFSWNEYKIEGQTQPVPALSNYLFQRDNLSNGNFVTIATLGASSISTTDPNYSTYQDSATWRVITAWSISCEPTKAGGHNSTRSNVQRNFVFSVPMLSENQSYLKISPNPTNGKFIMQLTDENKSIKNSQISICNIQGEIILKSVITDLKSEIDITNQPSGVYIVKVKSGDKVYHQKLVKE